MEVLERLRHTNGGEYNMDTLTGKFFQGILRKSEKAIMYDEILTEAQADGMINKSMSAKKLALKMTHVKKRYYY